MSSEVELEYLRLTAFDPPKTGEVEMGAGIWAPCTLLNYDWPMVRIRTYPTQSQYTITFWINEKHVRVAEGATA